MTSYKTIVFLISIILLSCRASHQYYDLWYRNEKSENLIKIYNEHILMYPKNWKPYYYLGLVYYKIGLRDGNDQLFIKSMTNLEKALEIDSNNKTINALLHFYKNYAIKLKSEKRFDECFNYYQRYTMLVDSYLELKSIDELD